MTTNRTIHGDVATCENCTKPIMYTLAGWIHMLTDARRCTLDREPADTIAEPSGDVPYAQEELDALVESVLA